MAKYEEVFNDTQDLYTKLIGDANLENINITILADHLKNFIPLFLEVQKAEEKMETK